MDEPGDGEYSRAPRIDELARICAALNQAGARYVLIGGFAVISYGLDRTTKDIDLLVSADDAAPIMDAFVKLPRVHQVIAHGPTKSSVVVDGGTSHGKRMYLNADLRVVTDEQFPFAQQVAGDARFVGRERRQNHTADVQ